MQAELPLWITAAGNPETCVAAGELGCGVLTHLLGQDFDELAEKIRSTASPGQRRGIRARVRSR